MQICIPVESDQGLQSAVCAHFGSAPAFMIVDTDSGSARAIPNRNQHHDHGQCTPLAALEGERVEGMVVGGIGRGALNRLSAASIPVYLAEQATVAEVLEAFRLGMLRLMGPSQACARHGHDHP